MEESGREVEAEGASSSRYCPPSHLESTASPPKLTDPLVLDHQLSEVPSPESECLAQLLVAFNTKFSTLKPTLQFLLLGIKRSLGLNSLLTLLSLDWVNRQLNLDLELEDLWLTNITSPKISIFMNVCIEATGVDRINAMEIEKLVNHATEDTGPTNNKQLPGRVKFQNSVTRVLESDVCASWAPQSRDMIRRVFASGLSEEFFARCRRGNEEVVEERRTGEMDLKVIFMLKID